jgi:hypothetical protein
MANSRKVGVVPVMRAGPHRARASTPGRSGSHGHTAAPPRASPRCRASRAARRHRPPSGSGWCRRSRWPSRGGCPARAPATWSRRPGSPRCPPSRPPGAPAAAHVRLGHGEQSEVGTAETERGPERLALADHHIGAALPRVNAAGPPPPDRPPRPTAPVASQIRRAAPMSSRQPR